MNQLVGPSDWPADFVSELSLYKLDDCRRSRCQTATSTLSGREPVQVVKHLLRSSKRVVAWTQAQPKTIAWNRAFLSNGQQVSRVESNEREIKGPIALGTRCHSTRRSYRRITRPKVNRRRQLGCSGIRAAKVSARTQCHGCSLFPVRHYNVWRGNHSSIELVGERHLWHTIGAAGVYCAQKRRCRWSKIIPRMDINICSFDGRCTHWFIRCCIPLSILDISPPPHSAFVSFRWA